MYCYNTNTHAPPLTTQQVVALLQKYQCPQAAIPYWLANLWYESAGFQPGIDLICAPNQLSGASSWAAGLWQINILAHTTIDLGTAHDPDKATAFCAGLSSQFTDFRPWQAWTDCVAQQFLQRFSAETGIPLTEPAPCGKNVFSWGTVAQPPPPVRPPVVVPPDFSAIESDLARLCNDLQDMAGKLGVTVAFPQVVQNGTALYAVAPGDSLSSIAAQYMSKADNWQALYAYNQNVIGDDPNTINPGTVLRIPPGF